MTLLEKVKEKGYAEKTAFSLIRSGKVLVNNEPNMYPNTKIKDEQIRIKGIKDYVSRGAYKLLKAIQEWNLDFNDKIVLDIGSSTGGFTEVSLEHGAAKVYALDVGTNQLDYSLRRKKEVVSLEKTNLKEITKNMFNDTIDIVTVDVSFISLKYVFKVLNDFENIIIVALIKPQFEAESKEVKEKGIVEETLHVGIIKKVITYANENDFKLIKLIKSPIKGNKSKNIEYLSLFKKEQ